VLDELRRAGRCASASRCRRQAPAALCEAVLDDPTRHARLDDWAREAGASTRTVARLFRQELGTGFAQWRQQVLLAKALTLAARKLPMGRIASELGYASPSAFSAMVRRSVGAPPRLFFG
jgi:AraC-like DNA-binding protein